MSLQHIIENKIPHKPILYSTPMVQAILEGRKTHTRRVIKQALSWDHNWQVKEVSDGPGWFHMNAGGQYALPWFECPYGQPGDLLWVRENYRIIGWPFEDDGNWYHIEYAGGDTQRNVQLCEDMHDEVALIEKLCNKMEKRCEPTVDETEEVFSWTSNQIKKHMPWSPSIHMPKLAARIWLQIKSVKVERLQDITEADAKQEGIQSIFRTGGDGIERQLWRHYLTDDTCLSGPSFGPKESFQSLWQKINGLDSWELNPWVWVIEFEVLSTNGAPDLELLLSSNLIREAIL